VVKGKFFSYPQIFGILDAPQIKGNPGAENLCNLWIVPLRAGLN